LVQVVNLISGIMFSRRMKYLKSYLH